MAIKTKTPKAEIKGDAAAKLLEAADELLCEKGYDGASMSDVAQRAGVNKALVFYYFSSKEQLFSRVVERYYEAHLKAMEPALSAKGTLEERLHRLVDAYVDYIQANHRYPRLVQQLVAGDPKHHQLVADNLALLADRVELLLREAAPKKGPLAARHFFLTFSGAVINFFTYAPVLTRWWGHDPLSPEGVAERKEHLHWLVDQLLQGLRQGRE